MRRGEVWTVADAASRWTVVVLSVDEYNGFRGWAYCLPIVRKPASGDSPYAVAMGEPDPVSGVAVVDVVERVPTTAGVERLGMLAGATFNHIQTAFRDLFDL